MLQLLIDFRYNSLMNRYLVPFFEDSFRVFLKIGLKSSRQWMLAVCWMVQEVLDFCQPDSVEGRTIRKRRRIGSSFFRSLWDEHTRAQDFRRRKECRNIVLDQAHTISLKTWIRKWIVFGQFHRQAFSLSDPRFVWLQLEHDVEKEKREKENEREERRWVKKR